MVLLPRGPAEDAGSNADQHQESRGQPAALLVKAGEVGDPGPRLRFTERLRARSKKGSELPGPKMLFSRTARLPIRPMLFAPPKEARDAPEAPDLGSFKNSAAHPQPSEPRRSKETAILGAAVVRGADAVLCWCLEEFLLVAPVLSESSGPTAQLSLWDSQRRP